MRATSSLVMGDNPMTIKVGCALSLQNCKIEDELIVEDGATEEEIEEAVREWAHQYFEWWRG